MIAAFVIPPAPAPYERGSCPKGLSQVAQGSGAGTQRAKCVSAHFGPK